MKIEIPSKTFLWGGYAALKGGAAGVICTKPEFIFCSDVMAHPTDQRRSSSFLEKLRFETFEVHPQSPSGIFLNQEKKSLSQMEVFKDPFYGAGGFGRSTAEFLSVYLYSKEMDFKNLIWDTQESEEVKNKNLEENSKSEELNRDKVKNKDRESYFERFSPLSKNLQFLRQAYLKTFSEGFQRPSAYDLMAQSISDLGGCICLEERNQRLSTSSCSWPFESLEVLLFKTNYKIKTHDHLKSIQSLDCEDLKEASRCVSEAFLNAQPEAFIKALKVFDAQKAEKNLITLDSLNMCAQFNKNFKGLYARGCGALGADVIAVFVSSDCNFSLVSLKADLATQGSLKFVAGTQDIV